MFPIMHHALIRTHHITSRKKVATLKAAAKKLGCSALLRSGGTPGIMYVRAEEEEAVRDWVGVVHVSLWAFSIGRRGLGRCPAREEGVGISIRFEWSSFAYSTTFSRGGSVVFCLDHAFRHIFCKTWKREGHLLCRERRTYLPELQQ